MRWKKNPGKFIAMATVPLQAPEAAAAELDRAVGRLGMRSVEIGASAGGRERMNDYYLFNLIGFLVETTLAAARMIFSGTLERYPDLKLCLSHSGGMALWTQGRLDHGFSAIPACQGVIDRPPSEYLKRMYFDTIAHRPEALRYVADIVGAGRIVMGTDYLFHVADPDPVKTVASIPGLTGDERASIEGSLAAYLLGLES
ncbi:MAG: amidohydrolase family protein [Nitrospinota bacterium]|nr:amidohydrolase family protein [Nitrospinota bacterium]MDP7504861.1 amidohydrolase family protein [Nitrospinota bacterium]